MTFSGSGILSAPVPSLTRKRHFERLEQRVQCLADERNALIFHRRTLAEIHGMER